MKKTCLRIIIVLALTLSTTIMAFAEERKPKAFDAYAAQYYEQIQGKDGEERKPKAFDAYAAPVFTLDNVIIYDNIEIMSVKSDARLVLYSGPEVDESTVITSSSQGYINWYVPVSGYYTLTWTDSWGGGWYSY